MKTILNALGITILVFIMSYLFIAIILWEYNPIYWEGTINIFWGFLRMAIVIFILTYLLILKKAC